MLLTVDRFEGDFAVCEKDDMQMVDIAISELPDGVTEGSVLSYDGAAYLLCLTEEADRASRIKEKMDSLFVD